MLTEERERELMREYLFYVGKAQLPKEALDAWKATLPPQELIYLTGRVAEWGKVFSVAAAEFGIALANGIASGIKSAAIDNHVSL